MDISFNDGSLDKLFVEKNDKEKAKKEFEKFVEQINNLKKNKIIDNMFVSNEMLDYPIVRGYTINDWLADKTINSNHRQFFRAFLGKAIYIDSNNVSSIIHANWRHVSRRINFHSARRRNEAMRWHRRLTTTQQMEI